MSAGAASVGGVFDRRDVLDLMHGRSRTTIGMGGAGVTGEAPDPWSEANEYSNVALS